MVHHRKPNSSLVCVAHLKPYCIEKTMHWALSMLIVYWDHDQPETLFCQVPDSGPSRSTV